MHACLKPLFSLRLPKRRKATLDDSAALTFPFPSPSVLVVQRQLPPQTSKVRGGVRHASYGILAQILHLCIRSILSEHRYSFNVRALWATQLCKRRDIILFRCQRNGLD